MTALSPHPNAPVLSADAHPSTLEVKHGETLWCQVSDQNLHKLTKYTTYVKPSRGCGPATSDVS